MMVGTMAAPSRGQRVGGQITAPLALAAETGNERPSAQAMISETGLLVRLDSLPQ